MRNVVFALIIIGLGALPYVCSPRGNPAHDTEYIDTRASGFVRTWGSHYGLADGRKLVVDANGNIYIAGNYDIRRQTDEGTGIDFYLGEDSYYHEMNGDGAYLAKYDKQGEIQWVRGWNGNVRASYEDVAVDSTGNIYLLGQFTGEVDFDLRDGVDIRKSDYIDPDPNDEIGSRRYGQDVFITKISPDWHHQWTQTWGGEGPDFAGTCAVDIQGNVYVSGYLFNDIDFDPGPNVDNRNPENGSEYLCKYNSNGAYQWVRTWHGIISHAIVTDDVGYVYITGSLEKTVDLDPGTGVSEHHLVGEHFLNKPFTNGFIIKLDVDGQFIWARTWDSGNLNFPADSCGGIDMAIDKRGNIWVLGHDAWYHGTPDPQNLGGFWTSHDHLRLFDSAGGGGKSVYKTREYVDMHWSSYWHLEVDSENNIYIAGSYNSKVYFGQGTVLESPDGWSEGFLIKCNQECITQWVITWGGTEGVRVGDMDLDSSGNIFITGLSSGTVDFDPGPDIDNRSAMSERSLDGYLVKYLPDGTLR